MKFQCSMICIWFFLRSLSRSLPLQCYGWCWCYCYCYFMWMNMFVYACFVCSWSEVYWKSGTHTQCINVLCWCDSCCVCVCINAATVVLLYYINECMCVCVLRIGHPIISMYWCTLTAHSNVNTNWKSF